MVIAVIGTINRDTIILPDGSRREGFGGILYNLVALADLVGEGDIICPICNVGEDVFPWIEEFMATYGKIDKSGIRKVGGRNNHATLRYRSDGEREEMLMGRVPPIEYHQIEPYLESDAILLNFISGFDLSLNTLRRAREQSAGLTFMDVHSLALGIDDGGRRFLRPMPNWSTWISQADMVQFNRSEAETTWGRRLSRKDDFLLFGRMVLECGPRCVLVTLGSSGSLLVEKLGEGIELIAFPAISGANLVDTTGCGDIFSAAFLIEYLRSENARHASRVANTVAGRRKLPLLMRPGSSPELFTEFDGF